MRALHLPESYGAIKPELPENQWFRLVIDSIDSGNDFPDKPGGP